MTVEEFEIFIEETRKEFRNLISVYLSGIKEEMKILIRDKLDKCSSGFEVTILEESLQDEFGLYLEELKGE